MPRGRPHEHARRDAEDRRHRPTEKARSDGRGRLRHRDRKDEGQECGRRRCCRLRRDDPRKEHAEANQRHGHHCGHPVGRNEGAEHGEAHACDVEASVGHESHVGPSRELHQQEEGERAERCEQADLRVRKSEMGDGEHQRHHDRGPDRALHDQEIGILGAQPAQCTRSRRSRSLRFGGVRHQAPADPPQGVGPTRTTTVRRAGSSSYAIGPAYASGAPPVSTPTRSGAPGSAPHRCATWRESRPSRVSLALICSANDSFSTRASWSVAFCSASAFLLVAPRVARYEARSSSSRVSKARNSRISSRFMPSTSRSSRIRSRCARSSGV